MLSSSSWLLINQKLKTRRHSSWTHHCIGIATSLERDIDTPSFSSLCVGRESYEPIFEATRKAMQESNENFQKKSVLLFAACLLNIPFMFWRQEVLAIFADGFIIKCPRIALALYSLLTLNAVHESPNETHHEVVDCRIVRKVDHASLFLISCSSSLYCY